MVLRKADCRVAGRKIDHAETAAGKRFGFRSRRFRRKTKALRDEGASACENQPSILGNSLHHDVVRASGEEGRGNVARDRTGHGSCAGAPSVSEEPGWVFDLNSCPRGREGPVGLCCCWRAPG